MSGDAEPAERPLGERRRVRVLPDDLCNQIAAGEVVERPASVVKELVENALDAGARRVVVDIESGGLALIRVADDGHGMDQKDALLATLRHATSKIQRLDDLRRIESFGFRGEALPSIASVSRFVLRTRRAEDDEGSEITIEGGGPAAAKPCGSAAGTSIEVRELFFNTPARRKFLKAVGTEAAHVTEVVQAAALAEPGVTVLLSRDGRVAREWLRAGSREERVRAMLAGEALAACRGQPRPLTLEALVSRPERAPSGAMGQSILVNGRPVKDRVLARAVANAYGSVLEPGRYPIGVVYLDLPHDLVDVNVHPQKSEVRFADGRAVADALFRVISADVAAAFNLPPPSLGAWQNRKQPKLVEEQPPGATSTWAWSSAPGAEPAPPPASSGDPSPDLPLPLVAHGAEPGVAGAPPVPYPTAAELAQQAAGRAVPSQTLRFVAQVRRTFLICEGSDGLYMVDQHAAAERVTFDKLRRAFRAREVAVQRLLFPVVCEVGAAEAALVDEAHDEIARAGLDVRASGPTSVAVHAVPLLLGKAAPERLVKDLLSELGRAGERAFSGAVDLALATMACHGSIRAGDVVAPEEAAALLTALDGVDFGGHCPHGRPIVMRIGWPELEQRVGRR